MVAQIPKGVYTIQNKLVIIKHPVSRGIKAYQKASKKIKAQSRQRRD